MPLFIVRLRDVSFFIYSIEMNGIIFMHSKTIKPKNNFHTYKTISLQFYNNNFL
jgi:hypothetical protein